LLIILLGIIRLPKPKLTSERKAENIFVARHIANAMLAAALFIVSLCLHLFAFKAGYINFNRIL